MSGRCAQAEAQLEAGPEPDPRPVPGLRVETTGGDHASVQELQLQSVPGGPPGTTGGWQAAGARARQGAAAALAAEA